MRKEKSAATLAREANLTEICLVCGGAAAVHQHYGAVCCYSCRAFFRRGISRIFACVVGDNQCQVNSITRTNCKKCRFERCLQVGMKPELVDATIKKKSKHTVSGMGLAERREEDEVQAAAASILASPGSILPHQLQFSPATHLLSPPRLPSQPLPMYQLSGISPQPRIDSSILLQSLEERTRLMPEQQQAHQPILQSNTVPYMDTSRYSSSLGSNPVRQQTYYVYHALTQTFEPVTIAEFLDQPAFEEVVEAESDMAVDDSEEEMQLHFMNTDNDEVVAEETMEQEITIEESPADERGVEGHVQFDQENEDHRIIQEYLRIQQRSVFLARSNSETSVNGAAEVINSPNIKPIPPSNDGFQLVKTHFSDVQLEIPNRPAPKIERTAPLPVLGAYADEPVHNGGGVDIEALVDLCFQEELAKGRALGGLRPPAPQSSESKPVLVVKPQMRNDIDIAYRNSGPTVSIFRSLATKEVSCPPAMSLLEPGEVRPEDLTYPSESRASRLRSYRRPVSSGRQISSEPGEILPDSPLEPGEIRPRAAVVLGSGPEPGEILPAKCDTLEPGEIPPETAAEMMLSWRHSAPVVDREEHLLQLRNPDYSHSTSTGNGSCSGGLADDDNVMPLHNITIASTVHVGPASCGPPQRRASVIQGPMKAATTTTMMTVPVVGFAEPDMAARLNVVGERSQAVAVIHHLPAALPSMPPPLQQSSTPSAPAQLDISSDLASIVSIAHSEEEMQTGEESSIITSAGEKSPEQRHGKRRRIGGGVMVAVSPKKRCTTRGHPVVSIGIARNKMLYLKFTLEEEFLMHQVLEARNLLVNSIFSQSTQSPTMANELIEYFKVASACSLTDRKISVNMAIFVQWARVLLEAVIKQGHNLLAPLRTATSKNLMPSLVQHSFYAYYAVCLAIFFGNQATSSMVSQEKFCGSTDEAAWKWYRKQVPFIEAATSLRMQDFTLYQEEGADLLYDTFTKAGQVTGSDEKLGALAGLLVLVSQPEGSPFAKSKHVKNLRNQTATIMYRYLCSQNSCDERKAAELTSSFVGLLENLNRCGKILLGDKDLIPGRRLPGLEKLSFSAEPAESLSSSQIPG